MKRIFMLYVGGLLLSLFLGGVVSVAYHYSWWFLILLAIPISFGYVLLSDLFLRINVENLKKVTIITAISFVVMIGSLVVAAYSQVDEKSFWGMAFAVTIFSYMAGIVLIGLTLPKRWEEKRKLEKKFPY
jgi:Na+-driven multidrug efflux pump